MNIVTDFRNAGSDNATISKILDQQYKMLDKLKIDYTRIMV